MGVGGVLLCFGCMVAQEPTEEKSQGRGGSMASGVTHISIYIYIYKYTYIYIYTTPPHMPTLFPVSGAMVGFRGLGFRSTKALYCTNVLGTQEQKRCTFPKKPLFFKPKQANMLLASFECLIMGLVSTSAMHPLGRGPLW